jgi:hypothetical protein
MIGRWILTSVFLGLVAMTAQVHAADRGGVRSGAFRLESGGAYPLTWRAAKIRRADHCWRGCLAHAGRDFQRCLRVEPATNCVPWNDAK